MKIHWAWVATALLCVAASGARAVERDRFLVRDTSDLVELCSATGGSEHAIEAIHFCHGYIVGAVQYHLAITEPGDRARMLCLPEPRPDRNSVVAQFVAWARAHQEHAKESAVDGLFRFLEQTFPCK